MQLEVSSSAPIHRQLLEIIFCFQPRYINITVTGIWCMARQLLAECFKHAHNSIPCTIYTIWGAQKLQECNQRTKLSLSGFTDEYSVS